MKGDPERLKEEISFRRRLDNYLYRLSRRAGEKDLEEIGRDMIRGLKRLTGSALAMVGIWDEFTESWYFPNFVDPCYQGCKIKKLRLSLGGVFAKAFEEKKTYISNFLSRDPHYRGLPEGHLPIKRVAIYPIIRQGKPKALVAIANAPKRYTRREREALEKLGEFYGLLLEAKEKTYKEEEKVLFKALYEKIGLGISLWNVARKPPRKLFANQEYESLGQDFEARLRPLLKETLKLASGETLCRHIKLSNPCERNFLCILKKLDSEGAMVAVQDIGRELRLQEELTEAEKAKAINILVGNLAHKFNNLLNVVISSLEICKSKPDSPELWLNKAEFAVQDLALLVRQLLLYARGEVLGKKPINLKDFLPRIAKFLKALVPQHLRFRVKIEENLPLVKIDPLALEQILVNLVVNAVEAYGSEPGTISLRIYLTHRHQHGKSPRTPYKVRVCSQKEARQWIAIEVKDRGQGIPPEQLAQILEPFYSTKGLGRGLGLAAVRTIVYAHEGCMVVSSKPKKETVFKILLPLNHENGEEGERP